MKPAMPSRNSSSMIEKGWSVVDFELHIWHWWQELLDNGRFRVTYLVKDEAGFHKIVPRFFIAHDRNLEKAHMEAEKAVREFYADQAAKKAS